MNLKNRCPDVCIKVRVHVIDIIHNGNINTYFSPRNTINVSIKRITDIYLPIDIQNQNIVGMNYTPNQVCNKK